MASRRARSNGVWNLRINVTPSGSVLAKVFGECALEVGDFTTAFERLAPKMLDGIRGIINSKGASAGWPWPGLKDKYYLKRKSRRGWSMAELVATSKLIKTTLGAHPKITKRSLTITNDLPYARAVQWRGWADGKNRVFMGVTPAMETQASEEMSAHIDAALARLAIKINQQDLEAT
jgi:hypothetical protein